MKNIQKYLIKEVEIKVEICFKRFFNFEIKIKKDIK